MGGSADNDAQKTRNLWWSAWRSQASGPPRWQVETIEPARLTCSQGRRLHLAGDPAGCICRVGQDVAFLVGHLDEIRCPAFLCDADTTR